MSELRLGLIENRLKGTRVNFEENVAFANGSAFLVGLLDDVAGDLRLNLRVDVAVERGDPFADDWDISLLDGSHLDVRRDSGSGRLLAAA